MFLNDKEKTKVIRWVTQHLEVLMAAEAKDVDLAVKPDLEGDTQEIEVMLITMAVQRTKNNQLA